MTSRYPFSNVARLPLSSPAAILSSRDIRSRPSPAVLLCVRAAARGEDGGAWRFSACDTGRRRSTDGTRAAGGRCGTRYGSRYAVGTDGPRRAAEPHVPIADARIPGKRREENKEPPKLTQRGLNANVHEKSALCVYIKCIRH